MGDSASVVVAEKDDAAAGVALSALIHATYELNKVCVRVRVWGCVSARVCVCVRVGVGMCECAGVCVRACGCVSLCTRVCGGLM